MFIAPSPAESPRWRRRRRSAHWHGSGLHGAGGGRDAGTVWHRVWPAPLCACLAAAQAVQLATERIGRAFSAPPCCMHLVVAPEAVGALAWQGVHLGLPAFERGWQHRSASRGHRRESSGSFAPPRGGFTSWWRRRRSARCLGLVLLLGCCQWLCLQLRGHVVRFCVVSFHAVQSGLTQEFIERPPPTWQTSRGTPHIVGTAC